MLGCINDSAIAHALQEAERPQPRTGTRRPEERRRASTNCDGDAGLARALQAAEVERQPPRTGTGAGAGDAAWARALQAAEERRWAVASRGQEEEAAPRSPSHGRSGWRRAARERTAPAALAHSDRSGHGCVERHSRMQVSGTIDFHNGVDLKIRAKVWHPRAESSASMRQAVKWAFTECLQDFGHDWTLETISQSVVAGCSRRGLDMEDLSLDLRGARPVGRERELVFHDDDFSEPSGSSNASSSIAAFRPRGGHGGDEPPRRQGSRRRFDAASEETHVLRASGPRLDTHTQHEAEQPAAGPAARGRGSSVSSTPTSDSEYESEESESDMEPVPGPRLSADEIRGMQSQRHEGGDNGPCVVCYSDFRLGERLRHLPCMHKFHAECIDRWLRGDMPGASACPICKCDVRA